MRCAWQAYINLLPHWMREEVDKQGSGKLQELRIRIGLEPEMVLQEGSRILSAKAQIDDIKFVHPKDVQDGRVDITPNDILTNFP